MTIAPADQTYASALADFQARAVAQAKAATPKDDPIARAMATAQAQAKSQDMGPAKAPGKGQIIDLTA
jgi:hypothetical protein